MCHHLSSLANLKKTLIIEQRSSSSVHYQRLLSSSGRLRRRRPRLHFPFFLSLLLNHFQSPICWSCCFSYTIQEFMAFRASMINPNSRSPLRHESGEKETRKWRFSLRRLVFSLFSCLLRKLAIKKLFSCLKERRRRWREETSQPAIKVIGPLKLERKSPLDHHSDLASFAIQWGRHSDKHKKLQ